MTLKEKVASDSRANGSLKTRKHIFRDETMTKLKTIAGPVGLLVALMTYTAVGGLVS